MDLYEYIKSLNNLFDNMQVRIKIYWEFYHCIYITNEERHVRINQWPIIYNQVSDTGSCEFVV
jgi:hypothetical protein